MKTKMKLFIGLCMLYVIATSCKKEPRPNPSNLTSNSAVSSNQTSEKITPKTSDTATLSIKKGMLEDSLTITITPDDLPSQGNSVLPINQNNADLCGVLDFDLEKEILEAAKNLSGISYSNANKTDCSGMFHKMVDEIRTDCPNVLLPTITEARTTRLIAQWYHDNGNLEIIRDAASKGDLIKPGTVMFFGYSLRRNSYDYQTMDITTLTTQGVGICHISIVTSVEMKDGKVVSYEMFHGRNPSKPSAITDSKLKPYRDDLPPYGNWDQPLLAVANIITPASE